METKNLWSELVKNQIKSEIFCPSDLIVTIDELYNVMVNLIQANNIPAIAELVNVNWDDTDLTQTRIIVKYMGDDAKENENIIQVLIGLDRLGNYTYIEEKVIFDKPNLPPFPRKFNDTPRPTISGCATIFLLCLFLIPGVIYLLYQASQQNKYDETIAKDNELSKEEQKAWNKAWESWEKQILHMSFLSSTNDVYGRFIQAISSLVKISIKTLFEDRKAELKERIEKASTEQQLKAELEKRKAEYK